MRTTVGIVGGGPSGLLLARLQHRAGIDSVVLESRDRAYVERRQRAGILEQATVDALCAAGAGGRLAREGIVHDGIELRYDRRAHRVDFPSLIGGRRVWVYAQTEVVKDLIALQLAEGGPLFFGAEVRAVEGADTVQPVIRYTHEGREHSLTCDYVVGCDGFHGAPGAERHRSRAGAKGLNLAAADVIVLARALGAWHESGSVELLDAYSDTCLRRVWRAEQFSYFMTTTLHTDPGQSGFDTRLQLSQLDRIATSPHAAAELAENYTGLPLG